jgi:S1-C subfamily serine protease
MTTNVTDRPSGPQPYAGPPWGEPDPWTSPLWGRPDTVAGYGPRGGEPPTDPPPAGPAVPPHPPRKGRRLAVVATVVAVALFVTAAIAAAALRSNHSTNAAPPRPSAVPSSPAPTQPPTQPSQAPSTAPSTAPSQGGAPTSPNQGSALTPQQQAAAAAVTPGLVDVVTTIGYNGAEGAGTGVVLSSDGLVLTNHHVVAGATKVRATDIGNGKTYDATVLGYDRTRDLAVIKLQGASGLTVAPLGTSSSVKVGDSVVAVGNAGGVGGTPSAVGGSVTALDQTITARDDATGTSQRLTGLIQIDAAIRPGDSGGALVDMNGKVVGIITAGSAGALDDTASGTTGFAIPIDQAKPVAQQIVDGKASDTVHIGPTAVLGIGVASQGGSAGGFGGGSGNGVTVGNVVPGSAADQAGITAGSVITEVGGHTIATPEDLVSVLGGYHPGDKVTVVWTDTAGSSHSASVTLGDGPVG